MEEPPGSEGDAPEPPPGPEPAEQPTEQAPAPQHHPPPDQYPPPPQYPPAQQQTPPGGYPPPTQQYPPQQQGYPPQQQGYPPQQPPGQYPPQQPPGQYPPQQPPYGQPPQYAGGPPPPPGAPPPTRSGNRPPPWLFILLAVLLAAGAAGAVVLLSGGDEAEAQTVSFEKPTEVGNDPFTPPADVHRKAKVEVTSGPFGGTGSDLVCDRDKLIRFLLANPGRLRAWALAVRIPPTKRSVVRFIRKLRAVTLVRDTRVTNHTYTNGQAVGFQAILQAGTAVLVDEKGDYVARCRCGNPLSEPVYIPEAVCLACPPNYEPPQPCSRCYTPYPSPPPVGDPQDYGLPSTPDPRDTPEPDPTPEQPPGDEIDCTRAARSQLEFEVCKERKGGQPREETPSGGDNGPAGCTFNPPGGTPTDTYTLSCSLFAPNITVSISLTRPDGGNERYSFTTDRQGAGSYTFPNNGPANPGVYSATVTGGGETVERSVSVSSG